ncbi:MAG TPA: alpha/beta hydrolase [Solirubrobacterales bacterium]|nr:alpha/beta hydrolase [Solirubrobacterales bacterium]
MTDQQKEIQLPQGTIRYREAGAGKPVVFVHGYLVDHRLWDGVVDRLSDRYRCVAPDWPLAAHQVPMNRDADLSPTGIARLIADFLAKLELDDVTVVGNDSGGAISQVLATNHPDRIGRLALTNCDTHENFPPGIFKAMPPLAKIPGGMLALSLPFRIEALARRAFAPFAKTRIPDELIASWMEPNKRSSAVRHDAAKVTAGMNKRYTLAAARKLSESQLPIRLLWAPEDKLFPISYAERLAGECSNAKVVSIADASTFVPLDQPERVAEEIAEFAASS